MKLNRCPICHSNFDIMTLAQDDASRQVLVRLAKFDTLTGIAVLGYLALFCPEKSQLSAGRTLALLNELEVLAGNDWQRFTVAMATTVETIQNKKRNGQTVKQFKNHNYLQKVLDDLPQNAGQSVVPMSANNVELPQVFSTGKKSKTSVTLDAIEARKL